MNSSKIELPRNLMIPQYLLDVSNRLFTSHYVRLLISQNKTPPRSYLPCYSDMPADRFYHWSERSLFLYPSAGTSACGFLGYPHRAKSWITGPYFPGGPANTTSF